MEIQIISIRKPQTASKVSAYIDAIVDNFLIKGFRLIAGDRGMFLSMPREKGKDGKWYDIVQAVDLSTKQELETAFINAYNENNQ